MRRSLLTSHLHTRRAWIVLGAWLLMAAILGAQALSFAHRSTHADGAPHVAAANGVSHGHSFGHDEGSASCAAFDAVLSAAQTPSPCTGLSDVALFGATTISIPPSRAYAAQIRGAQRARAPPGESAHTV